MKKFFEFFDEYFWKGCKDGLTNPFYIFAPPKPWEQIEKEIEEERKLKEKRKNGRK